MEAYILVYRYAPACTCEFEYTCVRVFVWWEWWWMGCFLGGPGGGGGAAEAWPDEQKQEHWLHLSLDFMKYMYIFHKKFFPQQECLWIVFGSWMGCCFSWFAELTWTDEVCEATVYFVSEMRWQYTSCSIMACANVCSSSDSGSSSSLIPADSTYRTIGCSILPHCMVRLGILSLIDRIVVSA